MIVPNRYTLEVHPPDRAAGVSDFAQAMQYAYCMHRPRDVSKDRDQLALLPRYTRYMLQCGFATNHIVRGLCGWYRVTAELVQVAMTSLPKENAMVSYSY